MCCVVRRGEGATYHGFEFEMYKPDLDLWRRSSSRERILRIPTIGKLK